MKGKPVDAERLANDLLYLVAHGPHPFAVICHRTRTEVYQLFVERIKEVFTQ